MRTAPQPLSDRHLQKVEEDARAKHPIPARLVVRLIARLRQAEAELERLRAQRAHASEGADLALAAIGGAASPADRE